MPAPSESRQVWLLKSNWQKVCAALEVMAERLEQVSRPKDAKDYIELSRKIREQIIREGEEL